MQRCNKCNVDIKADVKICPLCQNKLDTYEKTDNSTFPVVTLINKNGLWKKVMGLLVILISIICVLVDIAINDKISWSIFVLVSFLCISLSVIIGYNQKRSLSNLLFFEFLFLCFALPYWDRITDFSLWSINYALPILSSIFTACCFVLRCIFRRDYKRYCRNMLASSTLGIVCAILAIVGIINVLWVSVVSAVIGIIAILAMIIFDGKELLTEISRRLHV